MDANEFVNRKKIATMKGVGKSSVGDRKKARNEIEKWCSVQASTAGIKKMKLMKSSQ